MHADGTPFFWLGDTWWMGLCDRLKWPDDFKALAADRREKGFNVVQIVAGLYPDMPAFDDRGRNEAGFPWEKDYSHIRPEYFDKADERLFYLADQGIVPCVVGAWGYHLPWMGVEKMKKHWRYLIARYGALPVVWCVAGEINLPYYLDKGFPKGGEKQTADWEDVIRYVRKVNAFGRLVTVHPTGLPPLSGRALYKDQELLDFDMLQTGHGGREVLAPSIRTLRTSYESKPTMPVVNGEVCYEALLDRIPAEVAAADVLGQRPVGGGRPHLRGQRNLAGQPQGPALRQIASRRRLRTFAVGRGDEAAGVGSAGHGEASAGEVPVATVRAAPRMGGLGGRVPPRPFPGATGSGIPRATRRRTRRWRRASSAGRSSCPRGKPSSGPSCT